MLKKITFFLVVLAVLIGCSRPPVEGDKITITGIPDWLNPYYGALIIRSSTGETFAAGQVENIGDNSAVSFEIMDSKAKPWTGRNQAYTVVFELYPEETFTKDVLGGGKNPEDFCSWEKITLPLASESLSFYEADKPLKITGAIDRILDSFGKKVNEHAAIMSKVRNGDLYALIEGTATMREMNPILAELRPYAEKMTEKQKERYVELFQKFESNRLSQ
jgi:hypothetical protein